MKKLTLPLACLLAAAPAFVHAATATTDPVGGMTMTINGNGGSGAKLTLLSAPLRQAAVYQGKITGISSTTITVDDSPWSADEFNGSGVTHYVEIFSGSGDGIMTDITDTTSSVITIADDITSAVSVGDSFRIRPHTTVADLFGSANEAGLTAGASTGDSDTIVVYNNSAKSSKTVFYHDGSLGPAGWYDNSYNPAEDTIIYPEQGIYVKRIASGDATRVVTGGVKTGTSVIPIFDNLNIVSNPIPTDMTLDASGLYTGSDNSGIKAGQSTGDSDIITIFAADGSSKRYFYHDGTLGPAGWYDTSYNPSGSVNIPAGASILITRDASLPNFNWSPSL